METILIAGVETVAGANLASHFTDRGFRVCGTSADDRIAIDGVERIAGEPQHLDDIRRALLVAQPQRVVYCGPAAVSTWSAETGLADLQSGRAAARNWARAAAERGCPLTFLSSDAVFSGPWMFHEEDGASFCPSEEAETIRATETDVLELNHDALVLRTNVFGWSPDPADCGLIERALNRLEVGEHAGLGDGIAHATPIAAAHLSEIVERAHAEQLRGVFHVAGAERVSRAGFGRRLAEAFDIPAPYQPAGRVVDDRPVGFGRGETSLQTRKIRKALCVAMPTLAEGLARLRAELHDGRADSLRGTAALAHQRVA